MLRLVHPAPQGKVSACQKGSRSQALTPTPEEQKRIHAALKNIARAYGGRDVLAEVMSVPLSTIKSFQNRSYGFALVLARVAGIPVEQLLAGRPIEAGTCVVCGRKGAR